MPEPGRIPACLAERAGSLAEKGAAKFQTLGDGRGPVAVCRAFVVITVACLAGGCASDPFRTAELQEFATPVELVETPFFPQEKYHCGPAALATVLSDSGVEVQPDELVPKVWLPGRRGTLQAELLAASRDYGRIPYVIPPEFPALLAEVAAGRPVLVLQNLGIGLLPMWHYAVVVGYSPEPGEVILRSGTDKRRVTAASVFTRTWRRSNNWALVLLRPGELPANQDTHRFLRAVAAAESAGRLDLAEPAYARAIKRWPDSHLAWLGRGNSAYARGDSAGAERLYRQALQLEPGNLITINNLATALAGQGRCEEAAILLEGAVGRAPANSAIAEVLAQSQADLSGC